MINEEERTELTNQFGRSLTQHDDTNECVVGDYHPFM